MNDNEEPASSSAEAIMKLMDECTTLIEAATGLRARLRADDWPEDTCQAVSSVVLYTLFNAAFNGVSSD